MDKQGLLNVTTVKVKDRWLGNALSLNDQGMQHDPGVSNGKAVQTIIPNNADFQTEDLDTYDSDCDDISNAQAVLMANISNFGSNVISELQTSHPYTDQSATSLVKIEAPRELPKTRSCLKLKRKKLENERLLEHIFCQDVVNIVMHADIKSDNVLPVQNTFLDDNIALDVLKMENDHSMELLVSQDLVHTTVNSLAAINDYKSMERSYIEEYERNLKLAAELLQMSELLKTCSRLKQQPALHEMTSEQHSSGLSLHQLTLGYISSGLVQNSISPTPYVPPSKKDYEIMFQPLFDEYFSPSPRTVSPDSVVVVASRAVDLAGSPSSTNIDQDVPSASASPTN
nr:hypothetical protein [Tanacetum cinerariifolium]